MDAKLVCVLRRVTSTRIAARHDGVVIEVRVAHAIIGLFEDSPGQEELHGYGVQDLVELATRGAPGSSQGGGLSGF